MTSTASPQTSPLMLRRRPHPALWVSLWIAVAAAEVVLLWNDAAIDTWLWRTTRSLLREHPVPTGIWKTFRLFGHAGFTSGLVIATLLLCRRKLLFAISAVASTALTGGLTWLIAATLGRMRPLKEGVNDWDFLRGLPFGAENLAFPSGHTTLAFATAAVMVYFFPRSKWVAIPLAAGCAFSRVAQGAHFYGDVIFGSALGWSIAWLICTAAEQKFEKRLP